MPVVFEEAFTLALTATGGSQTTSGTFGAAYLWTTYSVTFTGSATSIYDVPSWSVVGITNGIQLTVNAASGTATATLVAYGARLVDEEPGVRSPALLRRVSS